MHAVEITHVGDAELVVDVVQFLTGQEADDAYAEATGDRSGVPNDVYVRNTSKELRTLAVTGDVEVTLAWNATGPGQFSAHYDDLAAAVEKYRDPFWITVEGGAVTAIHEQYMP